MKKLLMSSVVVLFLFLTISLISACVDCTPVGITKIKGTIYHQGDITNVIPRADVTVTCNAHENPSVKSNNIGEYVVYFPQTQCTFGDKVIVSAVKESLSGEEKGEININKFKFGCFRFDVGIINVPLVPEFGTTVGILTAMGAVGVFFLVRRK